VYNGNLRYLEQDGEAWNIELLAAGAGYGVRLAMDRAFHAHGVFRAGNRLVHVERTDETVEFKTLARRSEVGAGIDLVVNPAGRAVIAYYHRTTAEIRVVREVDEGWATKTVDVLSAAPTAALVALRLDAAGACISLRRRSPRFGTRPTPPAPGQTNRLRTKHA
jgi:hypothetical protein